MKSTFLLGVLGVFGASLCCPLSASAETYLYDATGALTRAVGDDGKSAGFAVDVAMNVEGFATANPLTGAPGGQVLLQATPVPLSNPASTGITATVNLSGFGGNATTAMTPSGNGTFSVLANIGPDTPLGTQLLEVTFTDAEGRTWTELLPVSLSSGVSAMPLWGYALLVALLVLLAARNLPRPTAVVLVFAFVALNARAEQQPLWQQTDLPLPDSVEAADVAGVVDPQNVDLPEEPQFQALATLSVPESVDAEIAALAAALGDGQAIAGESSGAKLLRIFTWVRNNIDYEHYQGLRKGSALTLLEGAGNDYDTCALLRDLLIAAGYPASSMRLHVANHGINYVDMAPWLGLSPTPFPGKTYLQAYGEPVSSYFGNAYSMSDEVAKQVRFAIEFLASRGSRNVLGGFPQFNPAAFPNTAQLVFARMTLLFISGSTGVLIDPSFKQYTKIEPSQNVASLTGYLRQPLLTAAGGTGNSTAAYGLSESGINGYLTARTSQLLGSLSGNLSGVRTEQLIGGREVQSFQIVNLFQASPPGLVFSPGSALHESFMVPALDSQKSNVNFSSGSLNYTIPTSELKGQKITLTFTGNTAELRFDDAAPVATTTVAGATMDLKIEMTHPSGLSQNITMTCRKGNAFSYALVYAFTGSERLLQKRYEQLKAYRDAGLADDSRQVRSETLNIMGLTWMNQKELAFRALATKNNVLHLSHHSLGRMAQEEGYYVDVSLNLSTARLNDARLDATTSARVDNVFHLGSLFASAMEHGIIEQMQPGSSAISTVNILRKANNTNNPMFLATSANWSSVSGQLNGYSNGQISDFGTFLNGSGAQIALPKTFGVTQGSWSGSGWIQRSPNIAGMIINGGYSLAGGYSTARSNVAPAPVAVQQAVSPARVYVAPSQPVKRPAPPTPTAPKFYASDPVDMSTGAFVYAADDMSTGTEGMPRGLAFSRDYNSNSATVDEQNLGYGWTHNLHIRAVSRSATDEVLGLSSPKYAAAFLTAMEAASDLYRSDATPKEWMAGILTIAWFIDTMKDNAVAVRMGKDVFQFIKQPDGTFTPPQDSTMTLTQVSNAYRLQQRLGNAINFDTYGKAANITDVDGKAMTFNYNANGTINYVEDAYARRFTFAYNGTHITSITDSTTPTRSVSFEYDSSTLWNLIRATDPEGKISHYDYVVPGDPGNTTADQHRIVRLRNHDNETITQNVWDSLGRVERQFLHGDTNKTFHLYYTGRDNFEVNPQGGITHYYYDERGRASGTLDAEGNLNHIGYDGQDRVTFRTSGAGEVTGYEYDGANNLTKINHPRGGGSTILQYDSLNRLDLVTDPNGAKTDYVYFASGNDLGKDRPWKVIEALGTADESTTTYTYYQSGAPIGRVQTITDGDNLQTTKTYDGTYARPLNTTAPGGFTTTEEYSPRGDLEFVTDPNGRKTAFKYNQRRELTSQVADQLGIAATGNMTFDNQARLATVTAPADNAGQRPIETRTYTPTDKVKLQKLNAVTVSDTSYDSRDWTANVKDAANRTTTLVRKANGDLKETQRPASRTTKFDYDGDNRLTQSKNPGSNSGTRVEGFVYTTTPAGLPRTLKTEADGRTVTSDFDAKGQLRFLKDRKANTFEFRYDALGRRTHVITPQGQTTRTDYKKNGRVALVTEPSGDTATFGYTNTTGRLANIAYSGTGGGTVNYTSYDSNGNLLTLNEGGNGSITRTYDGLNRVSSYTFAGQTIGYRYYSSGKLAKLIYPGGTENGTGHVEYTYNADGRLYQVIDKLDSTSSPRTTTYYWNLDGRLQSIARPNGTTRSILYDTAGRPYSITESAGLAWAIGYWTSDDIKTVNLTPAIAPAQLAPLPNAAMTFDSSNQLATFNGASITHDLDGNMVTGPIPATGAIGTYSYDSRNRLTSAGGLSYTYNAENNRISIGGNETTTLVVDPEGALPKVLARTKNGVTTRYVYGAGLQYEVSSAGVATYYHYDQTGNTAALTNQAGAIIDRIAYSPYGQIRYRTGTTDTPFLFGGFFGVMTDANGLINMRARYYNPLTMRFINSDPARDGLNWYAYASGNPINLADPTGLGAAKVVNAINSGLTSVGFAPINTSVINGPVSGFIHYVAGDKRPATLGPGLLQSIKNVQTEKPQLFSPTPTPENLGVFDYATIKHPIALLSKTAI